MKKILLLSVTVSVMFIQSLNSQTTTSRQVSLLVSAQVTLSPPQIIFKWPGDKTATNYLIYRKAKTSTNWGNSRATLTKTDSMWIDNTISAGDAYEYSFIKYIGTNQVAWSYLYAGLNFPVIESRGKVLLLVDSSYKEALSAQILRLMLDLVGDGWNVKRLYISRTSTVPEVKNIIKTEYNADKTINTVFLLGHIPVPYSGLFTIPPDGHVAGSGGHTGAWPADVYYGNLDGIWTDTGTDTTAARHDSWNLPGDGKFDQVALPSDVDLSIGRVDLYQMPSFSNNDTFLVKRYLDKDHNFRSGLANAKRRGLIDDNFTSYILTAQGWRSFAAMFGDTNIYDNIYKGNKDYFTDLQKESYLWSCGAGPGSYTTCGGIGATSDFVNDSIQTIFTMLTGSFFGDWNYPDNLLRAPLASKSPALVSFWGGIPQWELHTMALGDYIGYCAKLSQNNNDLLYYNGNFNGSTREVHIALMGDPTLRMHMVMPPAKLHVTGTTTKHLVWNKSKDNILGYNIYRGGYIWGSLKKINTNLVTDTTYTDIYPLPGVNVYMVRAEKLETTASGTYYNLSQGIFDTATFSLSAQNEIAASEGKINIFPNPSSGNINVQVTNTIEGETDIDIFNELGQNIISQKEHSPANSFTAGFNLSAFGKGLYFIRISSAKEVVTKKVIIR